MNKLKQKQFDHALITMPSCLASSAYHGNPYYDDYKTLVAFGQQQVELFRKKRNVSSDDYITNEVDCRSGEVWLKILSSKYPENHCRWIDRIVRQQAFNQPHPSAPCTGGGHEPQI